MLVLQQQKGTGPDSSVVWVSARGNGVRSGEREVTGSIPGPDIPKSLKSY